MTEFAHWFWQFNVDLSLLLGIILMARALLRRFATLYNLYLLWLSVPLALAASTILSNIDFTGSSIVEPVQRAVYEYIPNTHLAIENAVQPSLGYTPLVLVLALSIALLLVLRLVLQHQNLRKELRQIQTPDVLNIASIYPLVAVRKEGFSPAVYGFISPAIYFPRELVQQLSNRQLDLIVKHEEQHIRQGHLWLNLAWDALVCLLWFNPIVYFSRQAFRHDQELYCDYLVLKNSDSHDQRQYGHALISTVSATHSVSLLCSWKMFNQLEERILNIKSTFNTSKKLLISFAAGLLVCFASAYSLALAGEDAKHERKVKVIVKETQKNTLNINGDGVSYIEDDGEKYVIENGERRKMTAQDQAKYEALMQEVGIGIDGDIDLELDGQLSDGNRVISIRTNGDTDNAHLLEALKGLEGLKGLKALEGLKGLESLKGLPGLSGLAELKELEALKELEVLGESDIKFFIAGESELVAAEHELAEALKSVELAAANKNANKAELKKSAKELRDMQKQLKKERAQMEKTRERARLAAKNAREKVSSAL